MIPNSDNVELLHEFREKICAEIDIEREGVDRFIVYVPFMFEDGDHYVVILKKSQNGWIFTDEGHTLLHLSYSGVDVEKGTRTAIFEGHLLDHGLQNRKGELYLCVPDEDFGNALFSFIQGLVAVSGVTQITREHSTSTFREDFGSLLSEIIPKDRAHFDWYDKQHDPDGKYFVDCRINGNALPTFVFGVHNVSKCLNVTIACLWFEKWNIPFQGVVLFEKQEVINRKAVARLSDVVGKQFSSLGDKDRIKEYFESEGL